MRINNIALGAAIVSLLAGCSTTKLYEGENLSRENVAIIKGGSDLDFVSKLTAFIKSVDGIELSKTSTSVEVLPGDHTVVAKCTHMGDVLVPYSTNTETHMVEVEAGKTYKLYSGISQSGCTTKILSE